MTAALPCCAATVPIRPPGARAAAQAAKAAKSATRPRLLQERTTRRGAVTRDNMQEASSAVHNKGAREEQEFSVARTSKRGVSTRDDEGPDDPSDDEIGPIVIPPSYMHRRSSEAGVEVAARWRSAMKGCSLWPLSHSSTASAPASDERSADRPPTRRGTSCITSETLDYFDYRRTSDDFEVIPTVGGCSICSRTGSRPTSQANSRSPSLRGISAGDSSSADHSKHRNTCLPVTFGPQSPPPPPPPAHPPPDITEVQPGATSVC